MRVKFRGVRGSVPFSVPEGIIHGCNTPCLEIFDERTNGILILDAGSGIVGVSPPSLCKDPCPVSLMLTHYHCGTTCSGCHSLRTLLWRGVGGTSSIHTPTLVVARSGMARHHFQVAILPGALRAPAEQARASRWSSPGQWRYRFFGHLAESDHPGGCLAYRIKGAKGDFVYATDHEFGTLRWTSAGRVRQGSVGAGPRFTLHPEEIGQHKGWDNSDWRQCTDFAAAMTWSACICSITSRDAPIRR
jgi:hypothetical protein